MESQRQERGQCDAGRLEIVDGTEKKKYPLSPAELRGGKFTWERKSGEVEVRLSVENADGVKAQEASRVSGARAAKGGYLGISGDQGEAR
jgi:hypothetical protein